ncbi:NAD-dependent epimerase/dehydratase family protein [Psychrobacter raelei]|uniref:NAD-dependent epimerase/dehydratase family protein n=1 Tax=Psychrobacter raelei TaxID=2565531 RepID=A0AAT9PFF0_9GAMM|nr:NAD-dependent epimerase/dehydratase family protein [Psychrobacter sp. PraFG1]UNK05877.1 NAD-dependent epimerase/dehydratase family protein [Psychrobacter sp. PraFG1]
MESLTNTDLASSQTSKYLIIGQGDIGLAVTNVLAQQQLKVTGLARGERQSYDLNEQADYLQADALTLTAEQLYAFTHIAIIVTPDGYETKNYKHTYLGVAQHVANLADQLPKLQRVVFISSTGVYGQDNGEWIDDTVVPVAPKREASKYILQAEQALQQIFAERAVIIRPSGIYGEQRLMRLRQAKEADKAPMPVSAWTNRIMDTDLVTIIVKVLTLSASEPIAPMYLATDYVPVTSYELMVWLCNKLGTTPPAVLSETDKAQVSGKRLHSNIPRDWLQYPDWKSGYMHILQAIEA